MHAAAQEDIDGRLSDLERRQNETDAKIADTRSRLLDAFPAGDTEGHRRYHELQMQLLEERRRLRIAVQEKTISGLVWGLMVFIALAAWAYFKTLVTRP